MKILKNIWKGITVNNRNNFAIMNNKAKEGDTNLGLIILGGIQRKKKTNNLTIKLSPSKLPEGLFYFYAELAQWIRAVDL